MRLCLFYSTILLLSIILFGFHQWSLLAGLLLILFFGLENVFYAEILKVYSVFIFIICGISDFLGWKHIIVYPQYNDLLVMFT
jgi:hypothetical protein